MTARSTIDPNADPHDDYRRDVRATPCAICGSSEERLVNFDVVVRWIRERGRSFLKLPESDYAHAACVRQTLPKIGLPKSTAKTYSVVASTAWPRDDGEGALVVGEKYTLAVTETGYRYVYEAGVGPGEIKEGARVVCSFSDLDDLRSILRLV